jgi:hypothetical protein
LDCIVAVNRISYGFPTDDYYQSILGLQIPHEVVPLVCGFSIKTVVDVGCGSRLGARLRAGAHVIDGSM